MSWWKKAGKDISNTWKKAGKDISDTWKKAVKDVSEETMRTPKNVKKLGKAAWDTARDYVLGQGLTPPIAREYFKYLDLQAQGKWKRIPDDIQHIVGPHYPKVIMGNVRYAENIDTVHGQGITVENNIYFPGSVDLYSPGDFYWLLHELEHVGQYRVVGGRDAFVVKYLFQGGMEIFTKGSFNIHDSIHLEREALAKAKRIWEGTYRAIMHLVGTEYSNPTFAVEGWFGAENQGGGLATADLNGSGRPDLIVFHIDHPSGGNTGYYRIGWDLNAKGAVTGGWTKPAAVSGWFGATNQGGGLAVADLNGSGRPDLLVFHIDHPKGGNTGYYRIGWDLDAKGKVRGGWTDPIPVPGWFGAENQGGGLAVADLNGSGRPDLLVFHIDHPKGGNTGYYRIGWDLDAKGKVRGGWTDPTAVPGWFGAENQAGGLAVANVSGSKRPDLIVFHVDNPSGGNNGYYRIGRDLDAKGRVRGGWTDPKPTQSWYGYECQGGGISVVDLEGNGGAYLAAFHIDNPKDANNGYVTYLKLR